MEELRGTVDNIFYKNEDNGYTALEFHMGRESCTCVGILPFVSEGERILVRGEWVTHKSHGLQFSVTSYEPIEFDTLTGIERYLGSGALSGVGRSTARQIIKKFGLKSLEVIETQPERLLELKGMGQKRMELIAASYQQQAATRGAVLFLQTYELPLGLSRRIVERYGDRTIEIVRTAPYRLVRDVPGVGFQTADRIAMRMGFDRGDPGRLVEGISYALYDAMQREGHTYLPENELVSTAAELLDCPTEVIHNLIDGMILNRELAARLDARGARCIYLPGTFRAEAHVAIGLRARAAGNAHFQAPDVDAQIDAFEKRNDIEFESEQRTAILHAVQQGIVVITGGPGTGKTTTLNCILQILQRNGCKTLLAAPTGRAARRMKDATGEEARTIHRLLEYSPADGGQEFLRNEENPLEGDALIVDEMSMVDIFLMRSLLDAMPEGMRLVMLGDVDQLPSVGAGNVLRDIIDSGILPVVRLTQIFRQAAQSRIVTGAHAINHGELPVMNERSGDFFFEQKETQADCASAIIGLVKNRLPGFGPYDPLKDIQVLAPMKRGDAGVYALNRSLQAVLNPPAKDKPEHEVGDFIFRKGDKVMQMRNDYQQEWRSGDEEGQGVYNGDMGFIEDISPQDRTLSIRFDDGRLAEYAEGRWDMLSLAYCVSVHKSQGSEFPCVVMPVIAGSELLMTRNLLYTAVTRAKRLVVLVGSRARLSMMIGNNRITRRYSALAERIRALEALPMEGLSVERTRVDGASDEGTPMEMSALPLEGFLGTDSDGE